MSDAVLVRGSEAVWGKIAGRLVGLLLVCAGALFYFVLELSVLAMVSAAIGGALWLATDFYSIRNNRRKRWIIDTGDGFVVTDPSGERSYRDDQIASIALSVTENFSGGVRKSTRRRVLLWMEGEPHAIELDRVVRVGAADPIAPVVGRWLDNLKTRARTAMAQGGSLEGDGWSLRSSGLSIASKSGPVDVPPEARR
jgi:hypothetical protein